MRYYYIPTQQLPFKKLTIPNIDENVGMSNWKSETQLEEASVRITTWNSGIINQSSSMPTP